LPLRIPLHSTSQQYHQHTDQSSITTQLFYQSRFTKAKLPSLTFFPRTNIQDQRKSFIFPHAITMPFTASSDVISKMQNQLQRADSSSEGLPSHKTCDNRLPVRLDLPTSDLSEILPSLNPPIPFTGSQFVPEGARNCPQVWTCHECGNSGQSAWQNACSECGHLTCAYCTIYSPKR
jgi:hypothetical protein